MNFRKNIPFDGQRNDLLDENNVQQYTCTVGCMKLPENPDRLPGHLTEENLVPRSHQGMALSTSGDE
jgi:hypothetical protein